MTKPSYDRRSVCLIEHLFPHFQRLFQALGLHERQMIIWRSSNDIPKKIRDSRYSVSGYSLPRFDANSRTRHMRCNPDSRSVRI
jgi:hypothetical protein